MSDELTVEEKATNYDTMKHIHLVGKLLHMVAKELLDRADVHDNSKLESPELELLAKAKELGPITYGSKEFEEQKKTDLKIALDHHYANNDHHPEWQQRTEEWKYIKGYEGVYEISNYGRIRSIKRMIERPTVGNMSWGDKYLKFNVTPKGYLRTQLQYNLVYKNYFVHRLVAEAFIDNKEGKPEVNHKNGDKKDNRASNLEWVTKSENIQHAYDTGLKKGNIKYVVECPSLNLITHGCVSMEKALREKGYKKANAASIWRVINKGGTHLDLDFIGSKYETWMSSPINDMNLIQIMEMFCDWKASSTRHNDGNIRKSLEINGNRFGISPQLVKIFENTAILFDGVK